MGGISRPSYIALNRTTVHVQHQLKNLMNLKAAESTALEILENN